METLSAVTAGPILPVNVLIAEDDPSVAMAIEAGLMDAGFNIVGVAHDTQQVLGLLRLQRDDVAVLDVGLLMDPALKSIWPRLSERPVVFVTGSDLDDLPSWVDPEAIGSKPFSLCELVAKVNSALKRERTAGTGAGDQPLY